MDEAVQGQDREAAAADVVVVVGASAGGVEALRELVSSLPGDLRAAVLVVLHVASGWPSVLPGILARRARLPVAHARNGEPLLAGRVYVAPPDVHLLVADGHVRLVPGPRENGVRPAVDPLFRSAALAFGPCAIGVILSGTLDDGTLGLGELKRRGGRAVVQHPDDAMFAGMPRSACERVAVDHVVPLGEIAPTIVRLVGEMTGDAGATMAGAQGSDEIERNEERREIDGGARQNVGLGGELSGFTCPECHGALWEMRQGVVVRYRCRVGHAFAEDALQESKGVSIEAALWTALTALDEQAALTWRMAERAAAAGHEDRRRRYTDKALALEERARVVDRVLRAGTHAGAHAGTRAVADDDGVALAADLPRADTGAP